MEWFHSYMRVGVTLFILRTGDLQFRDYETVKRRSYTLWGQTPVHWNHPLKTKSMETLKKARDRELR